MVQIKHKDLHSGNLTVLLVLHDDLVHKSIVNQNILKPTILMN